MKKFREIYRPYMKRPVFYKTFSRFVIGLVPALVWERFIKSNPMLSVVEYAFLVVGMVLLMMAWFNYLSLDGVRIHHLLEKEPKPKRKKHHRRDIVDFVDEKIISFEELSYEEQKLCNLISNLTAGSVFIILSLIDTYLI